MEEMSLDYHLVAGELKEKEKDGGSYNPLETIERVLPNEEAFEDFLDTYATLEGYPLLYGDTEPFLRRLRDGHVPYKILTYGDQLWQSLKIETSAYQGDYEVTREVDKGKHIIGWQESDGVYAIHDKLSGVIYRAASVCLIDDKPKAFESLALGDTGFCIRRAEVIPSQAGELPPQVEMVYGLGHLAVRKNRIVYDLSV